MSYFNPKIFNRENLNDMDRAKLDYWHDEFDNVIENAFDDFESTGSTTVDKVRREFIADFCDALRERLGESLQENLVSIIDGYEHEVPEREEYTDYLYDPEEDNADDCDFLLCMTTPLVAIGAGVGLLAIILDFKDRK